MTHINRLPWQRLVATFIIILLVGCSSKLSFHGKRAQVEERRSFAEVSSEQAQFTTAHLIVDYSAKRQGSALLLQGNLILSDSVTNTFPAISFFNLKLNFLDGEGLFIADYDITPIYGTYSIASDKLPFSYTIDIPQGAESFAFSYWGEFQGIGEPEEKSGTWEIYHNPFAPEEKLIDLTPPQ